MLPSFGRLFGEPLPAYFIMMMVGFAVSVFLAVRWAKREGLDPEVMKDLGLMSLIAGVIGARLLHVLVDGSLSDYVNLCVDPGQVGWPTISRAQCEAVQETWLGSFTLGRWDAASGVCRPAEADCFAWAKFWSGGLVWYGGVLGAGLGVLWLIRKEGLPLSKTLDMFGLVLPVGLFFGRVGCFLGGCCFGVHSETFGVSFPPGSPASEQQWREGLLPSIAQPSLPVHPTQLYEAGGALAIAALCALWAYPRKRFDGQVFVLSMGAYAVLRFLLEFLRADDRGALLGLSTSQWIGFAILVGLWFLYRRFERGAAARRMAPLEEDGPTPVA
jgi:phosphatidylglycerol:prolipoprotein diacylglycerol transferase